MTASASAVQSRPSGRLRRAEGLVTRTILDETLIVPVKGTLAEIDRIYSLSGIGAAIWESLEGGPTLDEIRRSLGERYDAADATIAADLQEFVGELLRAGLVVETP
jgi:hypothetical protein